MTTMASEAPGVRQTLDLSRPVFKILVAAAILFLYIVGQPTHSRGYITDVDATSLPAWHLVEYRSLDLTEVRGTNPWIVSSAGGYHSNRSPGAIAIAALGYAITSPFTDGYAPWPGTMVAVVTSWLTVLVVAATADRLRKGTWFVAAVTFGLGTSTWAISSWTLWPHGPAQLAVALAVWALLRGREVGAGLLFGLSVLVRPTTAILGSGVALLKAFQEKSWKPLATIGGPTLLGTVAYLGYNKATFDSWSPLASYNAVGGLIGVEGFVGWLQNLAEALILPKNGVLVWSMWIGAGLLGLRLIEGMVPRWLYFSPMVAAAYVAIHSRLEIASGALPYNYRYPLEAVTLIAPLLLVTVPDFETTKSKRLLLGFTVLWSILLQFAFVVLSRCVIDSTGVEICFLFGY